VTVFLDANIILALSQTAQWGRVKPGVIDLVVPDVVEAEVTSPGARTRHAADVAAYEAAKQAGQFRVVTLVAGTPEYGAYLGFRGARISQRGNQGEDACVALAMFAPGSIVCTNDRSGANRALAALGDPARVWSLADLLAHL